MGFKNDAGEIVVSPRWRSIYYEFSEGMCPVTNDDKKFGFVNEAGELVIPCKFAFSLDFREGLCRVQDAETLMNGYINKKGETVRDGEKRFYIDHDGNKLAINYESSINMSIGKGLDFLQRMYFKSAYPVKAAIQDEIERLSSLK